MRILALERDLPAQPRPDLADLLRQEAAAVWQLHKTGIIREIWFTTEGRHAVLQLECHNAAAARGHLAALPLVRAGLSTFDLHELQPYDGFERLFAPDAGSLNRPHDEPAEY